MRKFSLATRAFLISLLPLCLFMTFIFIGLNVVLRDKARDGIKRFVHTSEALLDRMNENNHQRTAQVASLLTENAGLKASIGLLHEISEDSHLRQQAQRTIEEQLKDLHGLVGYDLMAIGDSQDRIVAAMELRDGHLTHSDALIRIPAQPSLVDVGGLLYELEPVPINLNGEPIGRLAVGKRFDLSLLDAIGDIAVQAPATIERLASLRSIPRGFERSKWGEAIVEAVNRGLARDYGTLPWIERPKPAQNGQATVELLKVLLRMTSEQHGVAAKVIATMDDLDRIVADDVADVPALAGWRRKLFGEQALALKHGRLALAVERNRVVAVER